MTGFNIARNDDEARIAAGKYADSRLIELDFSQKLGSGQDGWVWSSSRKTAVKSFYRPRTYRNERNCYFRLEEHDVSEIAGFAVPQLVDYDNDLMIIEIGIVSPPRVVDFGKARLDHPGDYSAEVIDEALRDNESDYPPEDWERMLEVVEDLKSYGIYYYDLKNGNIQIRSET